MMENVWQISVRVLQCWQKGRETGTMTKILEEGRKARLDVRVPPETKQLVERAANLEGMTLTQFTETALVQQARAVIANHERTVLSRRDQERFLALLEEDEGPNEALQRAIDRYLAAGFGPVVIPA